MQTDCLAAKHNLLLDTTGEVKLCCNSSQSLDYTLEYYETALTGNIATAIQTALDSGNLHSNCQRCWEEQKQGDHFSYRHSYNDMYPEFAKIKKQQLKTVHIQYDNTCNLSCVYCGPKFSSKWAGLLNEKTLFRQPVDFSDQVLASLHMITLAGGEPSLVKSNINLLARLFKLNPACQVIINTNLFNIESNPVFDLLFQFENSTIIASFEDVSDRYEYIRNGSSWKKFSQNFITVSKQVKTLQASMILFPLSIGGIHNAINFALDHIAPNEIYINDYYGNEFLWEHVAKYKLDQLQQNLIEFAHTLDISIQNQILSRIELIKSSALTTHFPAWDRRKQYMIKKNYADIFPELFE
jgi:organic radical activating enzyme